MMNGDSVIYLSDLLKLYLLSFEGITQVTDLFGVSMNDYSTFNLDGSN